MGKYTIRQNKTLITISYLEVIFKFFYITKFRNRISYTKALISICTHSPFSILFLHS